MGKSRRLDDIGDSMINHVIENNFIIYSILSSRIVLVY
jgi:hypothetical protein